MALSPDQRILCFDGTITGDLDGSLAKSLRDGGLFVVRSFGGDIHSAIVLADLLRERRATVVIYDYCVSACASFFFVASGQTYILKGAVVAWHDAASGLQDCPSLETPPDSGPRKLRRVPCPEIPRQYLTKNQSVMDDVDRFFRERTIDPSFEWPPDSLYVRRQLKNLYRDTGLYPNVIWTLNPRYLQKTFKAKIFYERYPESQDEVDGMLAPLGWKIGVIYDP
jgi:hypothetical protein